MFAKFVQTMKQYVIYFRESVRHMMQWPTGPDCKGPAQTSLNSVLWPEPMANTNKIILNVAKYRNVSLCVNGCVLLDMYVFCHVALILYQESKSNYKNTLKSNVTQKDWNLILKVTLKSNFKKEFLNRHFQRNFKIEM